MADTLQTHGGQMADTWPENGESAWAGTGRTHEGHKAGRRRTAHAEHMAD